MCGLRVFLIYIRVPLLTCGNTRYNRGCPRTQLPGTALRAPYIESPSLKSSIHTSLSIGSLFTLLFLSQKKIVKSFQTILLLYLGFELLVKHLSVYILAARVYV